MKNKLALALATVALVSLIVAGGTLAYFQKSSDIYDNKINVANGIEGDLVDEFNENQVLIPGGSVNKKVGIKVTGVLPAYGRIHVKMFWTNKNSSTPLSLGTGNKDLKVSNDWLKADTSDGKIDNTKWTLANTEENSAYIEYIYNRIGAISPNNDQNAEGEILFTKVDLKPGQDFGNQYANKTLHVVVSGDLIQATGNNEETAWDGFTSAPSAPKA